MACCYQSCGVLPRCPVFVPLWIGGSLRTRLGAALPVEHRGCCQPGRWDRTAGLQWWTTSVLLSGLLCLVPMEYPELEVLLLHPVVKTSQRRQPACVLPSSLFGREPRLSSLSHQTQGNLHNCDAVEGRCDPGGGQLCCWCDPGGGGLCCWCDLRRSGLCFQV